MFVKRHILNTSVDNIEREVATIAERLPKLLGKLKSDPLSVELGYALNLQIEAISGSALLERAQNEIYTHMYYGLQFGVNLFKIAMHPDKEVQLKIGSENIIAIGKEKMDYVTYGVWQTIYYLAVILRDRDALDFLVQIPGNFAKSSKVTFDDLDIAVFEIMKAAWTKNAVQKAIERYWGLEPVVKTASAVRDKFNKHLTTPSIKVLTAAFSGDNSSFNHELQKALTLHYEFYREAGKKHLGPDDPFGWLSYMLLWVCAFAHDAGMKIEVESDYIPRWMVEGDFKDCELLVS